MPVKRRVEFVSYDGEHPNLCSGALSVKLDGKPVIFKHSYKAKEDEEFFKPFWFADEYYYFGENNRAIVNLNGWAFVGDDFPEELSQYYFELCHVFAENVSAPHCGGCR